MNIQTIVEDNYEKLNDNDIYIWQYINHHKEEVVKSSIQSLAKNCNVSHTSIIRFCKKLNLDGFSELKVHIKIELEKVHTIDPLIVSKVSSELVSTARDYEEMDVSEILLLMYKSKRIFIYATGELQYNVAQEFKREFYYTKKMIYVIEGIDEVEMLLDNIRETDMFLFVSISGENVKMIENIRKIQPTGVPIVGIANGNRNRLKDYSTNYLPIYSTTFKSSYSNVTYYTSSHYFIIINMLCVRYMELYEPKKR